MRWTRPFLCSRREGFHGRPTFTCAPSFWRLSPSQAASVAHTRRISPSWIARFICSRPAARRSSPRWIKDADPPAYTATGSLGKALHRLSATHSAVVKYWLKMMAPFFSSHSCSFR